MRFDKETQTRILRVAADRSEGKNIEEVDERIAYVMDLHPEFDEVWEMGEMAIYPQEINGMIVNPFVHIVLHVIVDMQIQDEAPMFVEEAFHNLIELGVDEHEVLHKIMASYGDLHFGSFRRGDTFSTLEYEERLRNLEKAAKEAQADE